MKDKEFYSIVYSKGTLNVLQGEKKIERDVFRKIKSISNVYKLLGWNVSFIFFYFGFCTQDVDLFPTKQIMGLHYAFLTQFK